MIETGTLLQDRYLIEKQIGAGGMGAVYLAVDQRFGSYVAIKETFYKTDEFGDAFEREAHLLNSLHHPALPHVSDYFSEDGGHFLVMQFIEGEDLSEILKREGAFPVSVVLRWTDSLLDALDYLHSQASPIVHRDIKPQNLKITARDEIILLDFGLAKLNHADTTGVKSVFGYTRKYSPLEQIQGTGTDARSDIFSLAATAYHLLTGNPPIEVLARASEIVVGNPDPLVLASEINDEIPLGVATILNSALSLNAAGRFASAKEMRQALAGAVQDNSTNNANQSPERVIIVDAADDKSETADAEKFPALDAFVAKAANHPLTPEDYRTSKTLENSSANNRILSATLDTSPQSNSIVEVQTKVISRVKKSRFPLAAAAMLIFVGLATGYFISRANSSSAPMQTQAIQPTPEIVPNVEQTAVILVESTPEIPEPPTTIEAAQVKAKSATLEKRTEAAKPEEKKVVDERRIIANESDAAQPEKVGKPKVVTAPVEISRRQPARTASRRDSVDSGETRNRVVGSQPVPDIESIFTGRSSTQREETIQRRTERRQETTDGERRELRRQRSEEQRSRQNRSNLPF